MDSPEWATLHERHLLSNTDKNLDVAIVSHKWMYHWSSKLLLNKDVFEEVTPPKTIGSLVREFRLTLPVTPTMDHLEQVPTVTKFAKFYPLPRPHKGLPVKARPITGAVNVLTSTLSMALDQVFQTGLNMAKLKLADTPHIFTVVTNTEQTIDKIQGWLQQSQGQITKLTAYDFTDMYTNMNTDVTLDAIEWFFETFLDLPPEHKITVHVKKPRLNENGNVPIYPVNPNTGKPHKDIPLITEIRFPIRFIKSLTNVCIRQFSYVECEWLPGRQFRQIKGWAMGTNCAPSGSNLALLAQEIAFFSGGVMNFRFCRYIDDMLVAHDPDDEEAVVIALQTCYHPFRLKFETSPTLSSPFPTRHPRTVYLDLQFPSLQMDTFHFGLYTKPLNAYGVFHAQSYAPKGIAKGVVIGAALRISMRNSHPANAQADFILYCKLLNRQGYSNKFIMDTLLTYEQKVLKEIANPNPHSLRKPLDLFEYRPKLIHKDVRKTNEHHAYFVIADYCDRLPAKVLKPLVNQHFPRVPGKEHLQVQVAFRDAYNILRYSAKMRKLPDRSQATNVEVPADDFDPSLW